MFASMKDALKQYVALRSGLVSQKAELESRLHAINLALGESSAPAAVFTASASAPPAKRGPGRPPKAALAGADAPAAATKGGKRRGRGRSTDGTSLRDVAIKALLTHKVLGRQDLLKAVEAGGYKFSAKDPLNSLSTLVYSNKKIFKARDGQISLVNS